MEVPQHGAGAVAPGSSRDSQVLPTVVDVVVDLLLYMHVYACVYAYGARLAHDGELGLARRQLRGEKVVEDRGLCAAGRLRPTELRDGAPASKTSPRWPAKTAAKTVPRG